MPALGLHRTGPSAAKGGLRGAPRLTKDRFGNGKSSSSVVCPLVPPPGSNEELHPNAHTAGLVKLKGSQNKTKSSMNLESAPVWMWGLKGMGKLVGMDGRG